MLKFICILIVLFALTSCGNGDNTPIMQDETFPVPEAVTETVAYIEEITDDEEVETTHAIPDVFSFSLGDAIIEMDQNMVDVIEMLGTPMGEFVIPSCAFDGYDRVFSFPGIQIHTYPLGDDDFVHTISLRDDTVTTKNGIFLGRSFVDVKEAYGDEFTQEYGMVTFTRGQTTLSFLIENNMVIAITYGLTLDI